MVVWLFAGGGESEIQGLVPFLRENFPGCTFKRRTPIASKKGPKPGKAIHALGKTGRDLASQIKYQLKKSLRYERCECILVIDDLDCRDVERQRESLNAAIYSVEGSADIPRHVGFASPEIEAWLIADWDNTFAKHPDFRGVHPRLRHSFSHDFHVQFDNPEDFSEYDASKDACKEKLSEAIVQAVEDLIQKGERSTVRYKKGTHTPAMLRDAKAENIAVRCKIFRSMRNYLLDF